CGDDPEPFDGSCEGGTSYAAGPARAKDDTSYVSRESARAQTAPMSEKHVAPEEPNPAAAGGRPPDPPARRPRILRRALLLGGAGLALGVAGLGTTLALRVRRGGTSTAPLVTLRDCRVALPSTTPRLVIARGPSPET